MSAILLSIKPEYVEKIFNGTKQYEFRKHLAKENISKIVIYSTFPEMKIVGEVQVKQTLKMAKTPLWDITKKKAGISRNKYRKYFEKSTIACAYVLGKAKEYAQPRVLQDYGLSQAPQSFVYLKTCPYCDEVILKSSSNPILNNCKSEEHIIPKSLGNEEIVLPKGIICDNCNNYFAREIEKPFLENETIKLLRTFHTVPSRKGNIPPLDILINHEIAKFELDAKNNCCYIDLSPKTVNKICNKEISMFISKGINIESLRENYVVSRFLVKIFTETYTYFLYQNNILKDDCFFVFDQKMKELVNYVRQGNKNKEVYNYTVTQYKEIRPFSNDDFVFRITLNFNGKEIVGMTLLIFELKFDLFLYNNL